MALSEPEGKYLFANEAVAHTYIAKHTERRKTFRITSVNVKIFDINEELTRLAQGPVD